jgi:hypothetical protein
LTYQQHTQTEQSDRTPSAELSQNVGAQDAVKLTRELERLRTREQEVMALLGAATPEKIIHDLRNVLNEVQLLRALTERM